MSATFGPRSAAYAKGLSGIGEYVITDAEWLPYAYAAAVQLRERGTPFYGMLLYEERRSRVLLQNTGQVGAQVPDMDLRRSMVELFCNGDLKIGTGTANDLWPEPETGMIPLVGEYISLCDAILVRSYTEYARLVPLLRRPRKVEPVVVEPEIPAFTRTRAVGPAVVVWAPDRPSLQVSLHALALAEFLGEVTYVTGDGAPLPDYGGRFMRSGPETGAILARAGCVVCVDPDDPGAAVAFARTGIGVVAPLQSGAHEFVRDAVMFDYKNFRTIYAAVQIAIAQPATLRPLPVPPPLPSRLPLPAAEELPLVSVVVPTYNRREDLVRALTCLHAQTYPRIEILVMNDAGADVADIVAAFPRATLYTMPANAGVLKVITAGLGMINGEYVQLLADDDWLEPDHIEGMMAALLHTGATIAHGNTLIRFQDLHPGSEPVTTGYNLVTFAESTTPTGALIATSIAGNAMLFRRDMFAAIGPWDDDCILADQELQMRAANRFVMVYVDRVTAEFRARGSDNFSSRTDSSIELRRVYEEMHPRPDRPHVLAQRKATLENVASREKGVFAFPATIKISPKGPSGA